MQVKSKVFYAFIINIVSAIFYKINNSKKLIYKISIKTDLYAYKMIDYNL